LRAIRWDKVLGQELRAREYLINIQTRVLDAFWSLAQKNVDEALTYGSVYAKLEEIMNSTRNIREFLSNYFSKSPALAKVFNDFLTSVDAQYRYYGEKARSNFEVPITPQEWEKLRVLPEIWKSWISDMVSYIAPSETRDFNLIDLQGRSHSVSRTLDTRMLDVVSDTLPRVSGRVAYRVGERRYGPGYLGKSLFELGLEPGSTVYIEHAGGELIPKASFSNPVIVKGEQTLEVRETFIVGRIWGEQLGIRRFPMNMYVGQLLDEIQKDIERIFSADAGNWIQKSCSRYVSRVHAVIYQEGSAFYLLDVSLNGTLLITDEDRKYIRSGREEFDEIGRITPYRLSSRNTVKLFGASFDILIEKK